MSGYAKYWATQPWAVPQGLAVAFGAWLYINVFNGKPPLHMKEISPSEFAATPLAYLSNPDHHRVAFPKVPGQSSVPNAYAELQHKVKAKGSSAHHH